MYDPTIGRWISEDPLGFQMPDSPIESSYTAAGRQTDVEAELEDKRVPDRYDPTTGGWVSQEPRSAWGESNLYQYVNNRPAIATDPSGMDVYLVAGANFENHWLNRQFHQDIVVDRWGFEGQKLVKEEKQWFTYAFNGNPTLALRRNNGIWECLTSPLFSPLEGQVFDVTNFRKDGDGTIVSQLTTKPDQDVEFLGFLLKQVGKKAGYSSADNCRSWSQAMFEAASEKFGN